MNLTDSSQQKTTVMELHGGAGRGTERMLREVAQFNSASDRFQIFPFVIDPAPGKAMVLSRKASELGVPMSFQEAKIEELIEDQQLNGRPIVLQVDRAGPIANILKRIIGHPSPVMVYLLIRTPYNTLYGVRVVLQPHEETLKSQGALFFEKLNSFTVRSGSTHIFGESGTSEHLAVEPLYRKWFGDHMKRNIDKVTSGVDPESAPFEITPDGTKTMQMFIRDNRNGWADPFRMAEDLVENHLTAPLVRGEDFMIAEVGPDGIRFHTTRLRKTDGKLAVRGIVRLDPTSLREAEERKQLRRAAEQALRRAERQTLSRKWAVWTTD